MSASALLNNGLIAAVVGSAIAGVAGWPAIRGARRRDKQADLDRIAKHEADALAAQAAEFRRSLSTITQDRNYWRDKHDRLQERMQGPGGTA